MEGRRIRMGVMKAIIIKDIKKRKVLTEGEQKKRHLKALKLNSQLNHQNSSRYKLGSYPYSKVKNRCIITKRGRAINQTFKLSRLELCRWAKLSKLPGLEKSSW